MKIEVGRFYKTRDGRKIRIYAVDGEMDLPIHGAYLYKMQWTVCVWQAGGLSITTKDKDIVSEWEEPEEDKKAYFEELTEKWKSGGITDPGKYSGSGDVVIGSSKEKKPRIEIPKFDYTKYNGLTYDMGMAKWLNEEVRPVIQNWLDEPEEE